MKSKCLGKTAKGGKCKLNAGKDAIYCHHHDPSFKGKSKRKESKVIELLRLKLGKPKMEVDPRGDQHDPTARDKYIQKLLDDDVKELALAISGEEIPYIEGTTEFTRRVWMMIGWHLEDSMIDYNSMSQTCKSMWKILCEDKVWYQNHPLKGKFISTLMYRMPLSRVVEIVIPEGFDKLVKYNKLPPVADIVEVIQEERGPEFSHEQILGDVYYTLLEEMIQNNCDVDEDGDLCFEEEIKGGGILGTYQGKDPIKFVREPDKHQIFYSKHATWLMMRCMNPHKAWGVYKRFTRNLVGYDGERVIRLMKP